MSEQIVFKQTLVIHGPVKVIPPSFTHNEFLHEYGRDCIDLVSAMVDLSERSVRATPAIPMSAVLPKWAVTICPLLAFFRRSGNGDVHMSEPMEFRSSVDPRNGAFSAMDMFGIFPAFGLRGVCTLAALASMSRLVRNVKRGVDSAFELGLNLRGVSPMFGRGVDDRERGVWAGLGLEFKFSAKRAALPVFPRADSWSCRMGGLV